MFVAVASCKILECHGDYGRAIRNVPARTSQPLPVKIAVLTRTKNCKYHTYNRKSWQPTLIGRGQKIKYCTSDDHERVVRDTTTKKKSPSGLSLSQWAASQQH